MVSGVGCYLVSGHSTLFETQGAPAQGARRPLAVHLPRVTPGKDRGSLELFFIAFAPILRLN